MSLNPLVVCVASIIMDKVAEYLVLPDSWWDLRREGSKEEQQRSAIQRELVAELGPGHPLIGCSGEVVARSEASDDVLLLLQDGRWAIVHLTWRRAPEPPPWPIATFYDSVHAVEGALFSE
jgi:hypothetical protein